MPSVAVPSRWGEGLTGSLPSVCLHQQNIAGRMHAEVGRGAAKSPRMVLLALTRDEQRRRIGARPVADGLSRERPFKQRQLHVVLGLHLLQQPRRRFTAKAFFERRAWSRPGGHTPGEREWRLNDVQNSQIRAKGAGQIQTLPLHDPGGVGAIDATDDMCVWPATHISRPSSKVGRGAFLAKRFASVRAMSKVETTPSGTPS